MRVSVIQPCEMRPEIGMANIGTRARLSLAPARQHQETFLQLSKYPPGLWLALKPQEELGKHGEG